MLLSTSMYFDENFVFVFIFVMNHNVVRMTSLM
jgi:hypothetical protein